ncbi:2-deoxy-D-gluconate 3-dehydrogenase [Flagellimonas olearia]|uniref:2-deoxy-D-gluconate 3-dehydrogenase n=2 Tax=Flagellimonas olearia TaxID=552546 RepID=A0A444VLY1_9FLAO|nr:2-deoxy-D-gluconate 3-dehydrogenase [Allomuricauda olearia]
MNMESNSFKDKVVLVSGGLGDIGQAVALEFGKQGARIAISDIVDEETASHKLGAMDDLGITYRYDQADVSNGSAVNEWILKVEEAWGQMDIAIVNAAKVTLKNLQEITDQEWEKEIQVNLNGAFFMANAACKSFVKHEIEGNIVFLGSWAAHAAHINIPAYTVSKAALRMLCKTMALTYAENGIRVNEIAPGYVNAGLSKAVWEQDPSLAQEASARVPVRKLIEADEVAKQVSWLCLPSNRHTTGSTLLMDGGLSLIRTK